MAEGTNGDLAQGSLGRAGVSYEPSWRPQPARERVWVNALLFLVTVYTTTAAGMWSSVSLAEAVDPAALDWTIYFRPEYLVYGLPFSVVLLTILGTHEMGHYLAARRWGVRATLPYFIPFPSFIGTMGAVIKIKSRIPNRRALIDIGAAGPLAGFVVSVVALGVGLHLSKVIPAVPEGAITFGDSILTAWMADLVIGDLPDGADVYIHPIGLAGWIGLLVTFLNLMPRGQFDGGHIVYALLGHRYKLVSRGTVTGLLIFLVLGPPYGWLQAPSLQDMGWIWVLSRWWGWLLWAAVMVFFGFRHPPPEDPYTELGPGRKVVGYVSLAVFVLCFVPSPISFYSP